MDTRYRGYQLNPVATHQGWGVVLGDPAGHPADICLHQLQGHRGWRTPEAANQAAYSYIDALLNQDSSY